MSLLRKIYEWTITNAATKRAERGLAAVSFAESSFFPVPPDVMLVPMILARPARAWYLAALTTVSSVIGGLAGYAIGYYLAQSVGAWIIDLYGLQAGFEHFKQEFAQYGVLIILIKGLTPIPYKLVTIASGIAHFDILPFILASIVARGGRFFIVAALLRVYGERARLFIERYLPWCALAVAVVVVLGFVIAAGVV